MSEKNVASRPTWRPNPSGAGPFEMCLSATSSAVGPQEGLLNDPELVARKWEFGNDSLRALLRRAHGCPWHQWLFGSTDLVARRVRG